MSLMVYLISKHPSCDIHELEKQIPPPHNDLFGVEACRKELWGQEIMKEHGCHMIYSLKHSNIYAFDEDLEKLKRELNIILSNTDIFSDDYITFRVKNALEAIKVAEMHKDVVGVAIE